MIAVNKHTADFIRDRRSKGRYSFAIDDLYESVPKDKRNVRKDLDRLRDKGAILNIRRGFYTIIPDEYQNMGMIPVELYAADLMKYLNKDYYVGLLSAAMFHGAAHQQPQEFYIVTDTPKLRNIEKDKFVINFSEKRNFPKYGIEDKKTDAGYLRVSNKELTFIDLIYFEKHIGGLNRIFTVLDELREGIKAQHFKEVLKNEFPLTVLQRTGFILDHHFKSEMLSSILEKRLMNENIRITTLNPSGVNRGDVDDKWKVKVNIELESEI